jgi:hypothetical protein
MNRNMVLLLAVLSLYQPGCGQSPATAQESVETFRNPILPRGLDMDLAGRLFGFWTLSWLTERRSTEPGRDG